MWDVALAITVIVLLATGWPMWGLEFDRRRRAEKKLAVAEKSEELSRWCNDDLMRLLAMIYYLTDEGVCNQGRQYIREATEHFAKFSAGRKQDERPSWVRGDKR